MIKTLACCGGISFTQVRVTVETKMNHACSIETVNCVFVLAFFSNKNISSTPVVFWILWKNFAKKNYFIQHFKASFIDFMKSYFLKDLYRNKIYFTQMQFISLM